VKKTPKTRGVGEKCAPYGMYLYLKTLVGKNKEIDIALLKTYYEKT
jgi:hypothetical protein